MPYIRKLPSGMWQATVRGPDGKRHSDTFDLKGEAKKWGADEESKIAQGRWRDPRLGKIPFAEWAEKWFAARVVEDETRRGDRGVLGKHLLPHWGTWRMNTIGSLDVQQWVRKMQQDGAGKHAIRRAYNLFASSMNDAVRARVIGESPCLDIKRPATPRKLPAWFTRDQVDRIREQLLPARPGHAAMTELMVCVGLRWGEAAAVVGAVGERGNPVDWLRGRIRVIGALTQLGRWKEYPKSSKSRREVPVPRYVLEEMGPLLASRDRTGFVFVTTRGAKPLSGSNWRVVWYAAIDRANVKIGKDNRSLPEAQRLDAIPRLDPHDCRHTAASWLAQEGVPLYDIQALLGHESSSTTARYAHLQPDAHRSVEDAWKNILTHVRRTGTDTGPGKAV